MTELFLALHLPVSHCTLQWQAGQRFDWVTPWQIQDSLYRWILEYEQVNCLFLEPRGHVTAWGRALSTDELAGTLQIEMIINKTHPSDRPALLLGELPANRFFPHDRGLELVMDLIRSHGNTFLRR